MLDFLFFPLSNLDFLVFSSLYILRPKIFVAENVPGLVSANKGLAYKTILDDFRNLTDSWNEIINEYEILNKNIITKKRT